MERKYNNSTTMCIQEQKYKFQYKNKSFGTKKYFLKNLEKKNSRYFIYDYYYVPKYMLIVVYLNKPYIFHYYKLSRLFLYRNFNFCTEIYISVVGYTLLYCCYIFLSIFFLIFCTATFIYVLRFIFLYWDKYCCTVV